MVTRSRIPLPMFFLFACFHLPVPAQAPRVESYSLDATYLADQEKLQATADIRFDADSEKTDALVFYLHGELKVGKVELDGKDADGSQDQVYSRSDYSCVVRRCTIPLPDGKLPKRMHIQYSGAMNPSVAAAPSNYMRIDSDGVFLRSYPYSLWFPVFLEERQEAYPVDFTEVLLRTPKEYRSVFTGTWLEDRIEGDTRVSCWRADAASLFDAQWVARPYELIRKKGFFIYTLNDPASRNAANGVLEMTKRLDTYYRTHYRDKDPGGQLHIMQMPEYGDISSGNVVGIADESWMEIDKSPYAIYTLAHEYVHPFVQSRTPRTDPFYALMIEGFPSYFHLPALAEINGEAQYESDMKSWIEKSYLSKRKTGKDRRGRPLPEEKPLMKITVDEIGSYKDHYILSDRALLMMNYLRNRMGKSRFQEFTLELFDYDAINRKKFAETVLKFLPKAGEDLHIWLDTNDYPDRFRLKIE